MEIEAWESRPSLWCEFPDSVVDTRRWLGPKGLVFLLGS